MLLFKRVQQEDNVPQTFPNKRTEALLAIAEDTLWLLLETEESLGACKNISLQLKDVIFSACSFFILSLSACCTENA